MEELKSFFGEGSLTYEEFSQKLGEAKDTIKLVNLKTGNYVDKSKNDNFRHTKGCFFMGYKDLMVLRENV